MPSKQLPQHRLQWCKWVIFELYVKGIESVSVWLLRQLQGNSSPLGFSVYCSECSWKCWKSPVSTQPFSCIIFSMLQTHTNRNCWSEAGRWRDGRNTSRTLFKPRFWRHREPPGSNEPLDALRMSEFPFPLSWQLELLTLRIFLNFT